LGETSNGLARARYCENCPTLSTGFLIVLFSMLKGHSNRRAQSCVSRSGLLLLRFFAARQQDNSSRQ
jgi:hypothetical protein